MGSRYLILEFDDDKTAEAFRAKIDDASIRGRRYRVIGLFAKPTNYCQCDPALHTTTQTQASVLRRGKRFGWWVCTQCKRPAASLSGLENLIRPRDIIGAPTHEAGGHIWTSYISSLSGLFLGQPGRDFWNGR